MGLFSRKKKKNVVADTPAGMDGELLAVLGAAVAASSSDEHIAVIAAAIAAYEDGGAQTNLRVQKINRVAGVIPAWGMLGNREAIESRRI
ncbi:MAG: hypothetical protein LBG50_03155 [Clostridiales Family XIII bacterium]|jgi:ribosomal protein S16|nr:hypothetical protein [Clostridiales Family XIII bacterium]